MGPPSRDHFAFLMRSPLSDVVGPPIFGLCPEQFGMSVLDPTALADDQIISKTSKSSTVPLRLSSCTIDVQFPTSAEANWFDTRNVFCRCLLYDATRSRKLGGSRTGGRRFYCAADQRRTSSRTRHCASSFLLGLEPGHLFHTTYPHLLSMELGVDLDILLCPISLTDLPIIAERRYNGPSGAQRVRPNRLNSVSQCAKSADTRSQRPIS